MPECEYFQVCGLDGEPAGEGDTFLCILHSKDPEKDQQAFSEALAKHRQDEERWCNFSRMVFAVFADFTEATFT